ncbi:nicotinamide riboside transporter PnuC [Synoicihabitans lomoniglobus]|uniref:Nicotinamide riboside transporter PnuC n=1 Tax=Synoicihabitans lomoniglobus TaxID=2909285 RepID=A0AAE9ZWJ4_9BACT|nr:nicotinamide riboside transporter PnuC [Opitutaceae bacterium LMO-M01]WED65581.1 nicotinamide riboside transporter PnuC [Opitutaceae bacterium LMO-M01]
MTDGLQQIVDGLTDASPLDQVNLVLGIVGVALMIRRSLWAFPVGMVAVTVQGVLFWQWTFYADAKLQIFFFVCLGYGWWHWVKHKGNAPELPITTLGWPVRGAWIVGATLVMLGWGYWQSGHTDAVMPYRDTFIASFSMAAQVLQVRKRLENWAGWVAVNSVAVVTYWAAGLVYTSFLYTVFLGMGVLGWWQWWRAMTATTAATEEAATHG